MSCEECEEIQKNNKQNKDMAYLRIGNSNVLIGACDKHFNELRIELGYEYGHNHNEGYVYRVSVPEES